MEPTATPSTSGPVPVAMLPATAAGAGGQARSRILEASVALFARHGFDGVSTTRIAAEAGISQSVVLYHFGSKEKLWRAAMLHLFARIGVAGFASTEDIKDLDPISQLKVALRRFIKVSARHPELGRIIMREGAEGGSRLSWLARNALSANYAVYTGLVTAAQAAGQVKPYPPFHLTILLHAACSMLFNLQPLVEAVDGAPLDSAAGVEALSDMIIDTLFGGIAIRPEQQP